LTLIALKLAFKENVMPNPNHPPKNSVIRVEPIRDLKAIKNIKKLLADKPRDLAIFVIGTNTNLRSSCLTALTVKMVKNIEPGGHFTIREKKTGKTRTITVNKVVHEAISGLLKDLGEGVKDDDYLFQSRKGKGKLTTPTMNALVKGWCASVGLRGNYGSHSLRKTFG